MTIPLLAVNHHGLVKITTIVSFVQGMEKEQWLPSLHKRPYIRELSTFAS
jgi:hypothetical protein